MIAFTADVANFNTNASSYNYKILFVLLLMCLYLYISKDYPEMCELAATDLNSTEPTQMLANPPLPENSSGDKTA